MTISSSDASTTRGSSSSSSKLDQKKLTFFKKKKLGPANKRDIWLKPSKYKKTLQEVIDNISEQATDNTRMTRQGRGVVDMDSPAMHQAKEVQSKLPPEFPSFVKYMLKSQVSGGFWLSFPKSFCDKHMPKQDETFLLVNERVGEEHMVKYLFEKKGLSGGWRVFSTYHKLVEGDVLVFQLIESLKFKVYIVRANERAEIDGAMAQINSNSHTKTLENIVHTENEVDDDNEMITTDKYLKEPCETQNHQNDSMGNGLDSEPVGSENVDGIILATSVLEFKDVKGFNSFNILLDGLIIDTEIPTHIRYKYYELCRNQNSFLHHDLVKGLNCKLAAGIIYETVNVADAIKAAKVTVSLDHLQSWDKTLKAFEDMGMRVGFLRTCLNKLYEQQEIIRSKKLEQSQLQVEITDLESKLLERREVKKTLDAEIEALMIKDSRVEVAW